MPEVGSTCESEKLLGASSSSSPDANMQQNQEEDVWVRRENAEANKESDKSTGITATRKSNEDDMSDSESTNGSDSEVFLIFHFNPTTLTRGPHIKL